MAGNLPDYAYLLPCILASEYSEAIRPHPHLHLHLHLSVPRGENAARWFHVSKTCFENPRFGIQNLKLKVHKKEKKNKEKKK